MDAQSQIGEMTRRIRIALGSHGEMSLADLEMTVDAPPQLLDSALGLLSCEGMVELHNEKDRTNVRLKFN